MRQIVERHDADRPVRSIDDRQATDAIVPHDAGSGLDVVVGAAGMNLRVHAVGDSQLPEGLSVLVSAERDVAICQDADENAGGAHNRHATERAIAHQLGGTVEGVFRVQSLNRRSHDFLDVHGRLQRGVRAGTVPAGVRPGTPEIAQMLRRPPRHPQWLRMRTTRIQILYVAQRLLRAGSQCCTRS